ncbi:fibronectin type III domain-containing protein [Rhodohalobacter sp. 614A]|uniref:fibronectin type III domain-containing protein n=1 Tax=Rhodohalobacter sp. 614A TaxID=2908649 RepID=UPI001F37F8A2|nr:fibronectin type III domain-containing protein [Rhodohalobacter sp. 614A]
MSVRLFDLYGIRNSAIAVDLPPPIITSIDDGNQQLTVHFTYDDSVYPITDVEYSLDEEGWISSEMSTSPVVISGLTNGQTYSVRVRIVSGTNLSEPSNSANGTPATVPEAPTITSINSGNQEIFVNFLLGFNGGSPVTDIEYRLDGGSWQAGGTTTSPLVIGDQPNQEEMTDIEIRTTNSVGPSPASNIIQGRAAKRLDLERYFTLDTDLFSAIDNLTFSTVEVGNQVVLHHMNRTTDTPYESWERLPSGSGINDPKAAWTRGITGSLMIDHQGNLRLYYNLIFPYTDDQDEAQNKRALAVMRSTNNGTSWDKIITNGRPDLVDNATESNMINFPAPSGVGKNDVDSVKIIYDASSEKYIALSLWYSLGSEYFISISDDGLTGWSTPQSVITNVPGDDNPGSLFFDENSNEWVIAFRGRGRSSGQFQNWPTPYYLTRWLGMATAATYDGPYSILTDNGNHIIVDPANVYDYGSEADQVSFWELVDTQKGCANGSEHYEPISEEESKVRTDFQTTPVIFYAGQYFVIPSAYFRNDERALYRRPDRTDGPTYPVWGHSRTKTGLSPQHSGQVEGAWKFPDMNRPAVNLSPYLRVDTNQCNLSNGANEVGRVSPGCGFVVHNNGSTDRIIVGVIVANTLEEQRQLNVNTDLDAEWTIAIHHIERDRFAKLVAGGIEGSWQTSRLNIPYGTTGLYLNSEGTILVEILNSITGTPISGFTKSDSEIITQNGLNNEVTWSSHLIDELEGQNCRLRIYVTNGAVYSFRFD